MRPRLAPSVPNPFYDETRLGFDLPVAGRIRLRVVDVRGRLVRVLADGRHPAGPGSVVWDGRDQDGAVVSSGVYFVRLETEQGSRSYRVVRALR